MGTVSLSSPFQGDSVVLGDMRYIVVRHTKIEADKKDEVFLVFE